MIAMGFWTEPRAHQNFLLGAHMMRKASFEDFSPMFERSILTPYSLCIVRTRTRRYVCRFSGNFTLDCGILLHYSSKEMQLLRLAKHQCMHFAHNLGL